MNCGGIVKFDPKKKIRVSPDVYKKAVERWGEAEVKKLKIVIDKQFVKK